MPLQVEGSRIQILGNAASSNMMGSIRRARELSDIAPQYVAKSGLCSASELESSRGGSIRIQHVTGLASAGEGKSRFPKLDECAHFHYEHVEIGPLQVSLVDDDDLKPLSNETDEEKWWSLSVTSQNKTWLIRRSYDNFRMLDQQLHRCIYDRKFSELAELPVECIEEQENIHKLLTDYLSRFSAIAGSLINCGPVLNWLELDNRGHRLLVPDTDNCPINTPAVAAAYSVKRYTAQAADEISFEVGDMISVIDMPPPEESIWWRGKRGFQVGFFPCECVAVIGDKVPRNLHFTPQMSQPTKPVLRKHGKLIAFFRSFILSRPSRRKLKQSGILRERVFGCDLGEHLLNSGHEIPVVLKCCVEFIETHGLVDGIYRLSGVTSNIQKLRNAFDEDRVPALYEDEAILQDVHSVASLLKMYFRELPNPLCTYQLYHQFVGAVQATQGDDTRLLKMRDVVQKLPPPHYRTLEFLMKHLARVSEKGHETGMTSRNVAIVWAPNLLRCKELEVGGVAALQGVGVQAVVTEFLVCYADLIFCDRLPNFSLPPQQVSSKKCRPKSLAISTPTKLLSLEEARNRALLQAAGKTEPDYIEVGGGPANLPVKYHTVIELPGGSRKRLGSKRSPIGWKMLFGKSGRGSQSRKEVESKASASSDLGLQTGKAVTELDLTQSRRRLRPAKSAESLSSARNSGTLDFLEPLQGGVTGLEDTLSPMLLRNGEGKSNGHNRSVSHESYFDHLQDQKEDAALDISEIQVNFDLEESEMRIFSEDETLVSVGSGSLASNSSPRIVVSQKSGKSLLSSVNKRLSYPKLATGEDRFSSSQSADPSPKKQKTNDGLPPRSKLEEQLSSSAGDIQFIDSVSPDQVLVEAEIHPIQSPSPVSSISQISSSVLAPSSPILPHIPHLRRPLPQAITNESGLDGNASLDGNTSNHGTATKSVDSFYANRAVRPLSTVSSEMSPHSYLTSPSLAEATISDNESFSLQSSELTTPETPICRAYTPLVDFEESSISNKTTPDFDVDFKSRKSSSDADNLDKTMAKANLEFDCCKNIGKEFAKFEEKITSDNLAFQPTSAYENLSSDLVKMEVLKSEEIVPPKPEERKRRPLHPYENIPLTKPEVEPRKSLEPSVDSKEKQEKSSNRSSVISIKYERISTESSCDSLVNANRGEDNSSLLGFNSNKENPVIESMQTDFPIQNSGEPTFEVEDARTSRKDPRQKGFEDSEMDLLSECTKWFEDKQQFLSTKNALETKSEGIYSRDCLRPETCRDVETEFSVDKCSDLNQVNVAFRPSQGIQDPSFSVGLRGREGFEDEVVEKNGEFEVAENRVSRAESENAEETVASGIPFECVSDAKLRGQPEMEIGGEKCLENLGETSRKEEDQMAQKLLVTDFSVSDCFSKKAEEKKILETDIDEINRFEDDVAPSPAGDRKAEIKATPKKKMSPQKSNSSGNVRQLLSKFEVSPTTEKGLMELGLDVENLKKKKDSKEGSLNVNPMKKNNEERPKTLERLSTKRKTEKDFGDPPEVLLEKSKSGSEIEGKRCGSGKLDVLLNGEFDLSDPQRRERIEKYKEKRRNYLREKYRSDSFKNERDDFVLKIKQRHTHKNERTEARGREMKEKGLPTFDKADVNLSPSHSSGSKSPQKKNPAWERPASKNDLPNVLEFARDPCRTSFPAQGSGRFRYENPTISSSLREHTNRKSNFLRFSNERKSANDFRSTRSSPEKRNLSLDFSSTANSREDRTSPEFLSGGYSPRRRMTDPSRPSARNASDVSSESTRPNRLSCNVDGRDGILGESSSTPSFGIRDVAVLFEKRDNSKTHKQYLSSV